MANPTQSDFLAQHALMLQIAGLQSSLGSLLEYSVTQLPAQVAQLSRSMDAVAESVELLLYRAQAQNLKDHGPTRAGVWSFEHGGIFAGTRINPNLPMHLVYIGALVDRSLVQEDFLQSLLVPEDGGGDWFDCGKNFDLLKFVFQHLSRHPMFVPYQHWFSHEMDSSEVAPFVMPVRLVPCRSA